MHNHKHRKTQTLTIIARRTGPYSSSAFSSCYPIIQPNHVEYTRGNIQRQILDENRALLLRICSKCHVEPKSIPRSVVNWIFWKKRALLWVVRNGEYLWNLDCGGISWKGVVDGKSYDGKKGIGRTGKKSGEWRVDCENVWHMMWVEMARMERKWKKWEWWDVQEWVW